MKRKPTASTLILLSLMLNISFVNAKTFNIATLASSATSKECLDYCIDGACFYLVCGVLGCAIKTTPHINHNLPDFVVSSYKRPGENPFQEIKMLDYKSGINGSNIATRDKHNDNLAFKEVSIVGNPVAYALGQQRYFCPTNIYPMQPYYLSTWDNKMWRSGLSELLYPATYLPGVNEVGPVLKSWGSVYPRIGFLHQSNDYKTASVIAQRGLSIIKDGGLHIHQSPLATNAKTHGKWQMLSPQPENKCKRLGFENHQTILNKKDKDGQYAWTVWSNYGCCIPSAGVFVGSTVTGCMR